MSDSFVLISEARLSLTYDVGPENVQRHVEIFETLASRTGVGVSVG